MSFNFIDKFIEKIRLVKQNRVKEQLEDISKELHAEKAGHTAGAFLAEIERKVLELKQDISAQEKEEYHLTKLIDACDYINKMKNVKDLIELIEQEHILIEEELSSQDANDLKPTILYDETRADLELTDSEKLELVG